jgi:hypothetical protein
MATELFWRLGSVGNWFTPDNWATGIVPGAGDTAIVRSGEAIISSSQPRSITGETIMLGGSESSSPVTLKAVDVTFEGSGSGASEVNTTLTVTGSHSHRVNATLIAEGNTSFDGQIFVQAVGGSLTIDSESNGTSPGRFSFLNTDRKAAMVVSQESSLLLTGDTFFNNGLIQIEGSANIDAGATFTGKGGVFLLENGGEISIEGNVDQSQQIAFGDGTGELTINNIAEFDGIISYEQLPLSSEGELTIGVAGGRIDLPGVQAQSVKFVQGTGSKGTLHLYDGPNGTGEVVAQLTMQMVNDHLEPVPRNSSTLSSDDFSLSSDGEGGTLVTYSPGGATHLHASLPTPVVATAGSVVPLTTILLQSFGTADMPFGGVWLLPTEPSENTPTDVKYWAKPYTSPEWFIGDQKVDKAKFVTDLANVTLHVGNQIDNPASFRVQVTEDRTGPNAEWITYDAWTVDPVIAQLVQGTGSVPSRPTPEAVVSSALAFAAIYGDGVVLNTNLCNWIADNVAAGAGASLPLPNTSLDPTLNADGGFWRIAYKGTGPAPVQDWSNLVQPGDIVRMGWLKPENGLASGHSTTVLGHVNAEGEILFYDNIDWINDKEYIGIHPDNYWLHTNPQDITIYRLDPKQQYLIEGTNLKEVIQGSVHNDLIRPGGGADTINGGPGNNEIQGTTAQLNGITIADFNLGDTLSFTDLNPAHMRVSYDEEAGTLDIFVKQDEVASITLPTPPKGESFIVTPDGACGTIIELASKKTWMSTDIRELLANPDSGGIGHAASAFAKGHHGSHQQYDLLI